MDPLTNPAYLFFFAIAPLLIAFVKQANLSTQVNALIAFACYVVIGTAGAVVSGEALTLENVVPLITIATLVGTAAYNLVWNNLLVSGPTAPSLDKRLEVATSFFK